MRVRQGRYDGNFSRIYPTLAISRGLKPPAGAGAGAGAGADSIYSWVMLGFVPQPNLRSI